MIHILEHPNNIGQCYPTKHMLLQVKNMKSNYSDGIGSDKIPTQIDSVKMPK